MSSRWLPNLGNLIAMALLNAFCGLIAALNAADQSTSPETKPAANLGAASASVPTTATAATTAETEAAVDYPRQIKPLLVARCVKCHGAQEQESGLRLDTAELARKGGSSGPAIVAGKSAESLLLKAVTGKGDISKMPPEGEPLTGAEVDLLRRWIDQGALSAQAEQAAPSQPAKSSHWAFQPIARVAPPSVKQSSWVRNPIDQFVLAKLEAAGLTPSAEADRYTLIRRLSFDLLGLPPSPEEVLEFVHDTRSDAYDRLVARLLASPHYGERWGRHWLDLARYADSNGFTIDGPRSIWMYRDWVIDALNRDLPFDQFTIEQFAGDMLPTPTTDQIVATGFHRNTLINQEGGTDPEQFRVEAVVDRVNTTGAVFLGLTVGCAQCHAHKYDPISQQEYYQLFAFLNNADEPTLLQPTPEQSRQQDQIKRDLAAAEKALQAYDSSHPESPQLASSLDRVWTMIEAAEVVSQGGATFTRLADQSLLVGGDVPATDRYTLRFDIPPGTYSALRLEALTHDTLPKRGPGLSETGNFVLSELSLSWRPQREKGQEVAASAEPAAPQAAGPAATTLALASAKADAQRPEWPAAHAIDGEPKTGWSVPVAADTPNVERQLSVRFKTPWKLTEPASLELVVAQNFEEMPRSSLGRFQVSLSSLPSKMLDQAEQLQTILALDPAKRSKAQQDLLSAELNKSQPERAALAARVTDLKLEERKLAGAISTTMIMRERAAPRETFVHIRGDFLRHGAQVTPGVPAVLPSLSADVQQPTRLDLARWLVQTNQPLTPRVTVNRFWQKYFGQGLVETENDFGTQGSPPTHPELLDWLSGEFVRNGWSQKSIHRLIVASATYRQASTVRPELLKVDPRNKLLARQARVRLEAETIRDAALEAAGLLSHKIGGPSVFPPQPAGIYRFTQQDKQWKESQGADRYRRGMYTYFWRSSPYPFLLTFDAPGGNVTCTRRMPSNTPLQALTLANDLAFFEFAQGLALRVLKEPAGDDALRLERAFRWSLGRYPTPREEERLLAFVASQKSDFASHPDDAAKASPPGLPESCTAADGAAWTALARVLFNLDEFITRE